MPLKLCYKQNNMLFTTSNGGIVWENISRIETQLRLLSFKLFCILFFAKGTCLDIYWRFLSPACFVFDFADVFFFSPTQLNPFEVLLELNFHSLLKGVSLSFVYRKIRKNLRTLSLYQTIESGNRMQSKGGSGEVRWCEFMKQATSRILF